jgi:hypothetical protein
MVTQQSESTPKHAMGAALANALAGPGRGRMVAGPTS